MQLADLPQTERVIIEMTNAFRAEQNLGAVKADATLAKAAKAFATYLAGTGRFGHTVDGRQPADRTKEVGYKHCIVAENLAMNQDSRGFESRALANQAVTGWKNSPPHRAAMLNPHVTDIGVGIAKAVDNAPKYLSVQLFGRPESFKYSFQVRNLAAATVRYRFKSERVDVPRNTLITQTACTPDVLTFEGIKGEFKAADGTLFKLSSAPDGSLQLETERK